MSVQKINTSHFYVNPIVHAGTPRLYALGGHILNINYRCMDYEYRLDMISVLSDLHDQSTLPRAAVYWDSTEIARCAA